jgi:hypothetical protein
VNVPIDTPFPDEPPLEEEEDPLEPPLEEEEDPPEDGDVPPLEADAPPLEVEAPPLEDEDPPDALEPPPLAPVPPVKTGVVTPLELDPLEELTGPGPQPAAPAAQIPSTTPNAPTADR